jgi:hypothetical protein
MTQHDVEPIEIEEKGIRMILVLYITCTGDILPNH